MVLGDSLDVGNYSLRLCHITLVLFGFAFCSFLDYCGLFSKRRKNFSKRNLDCTFLVFCCRTIGLFRNSGVSKRISLCF